MFVLSEKSISMNPESQLPFLKAVSPLITGFLPSSTDVNQMAITFARESFYNTMMGEKKGKTLPLLFYVVTRENYGHVYEDLD